MKTLHDSLPELRAIILASTYANPESWADFTELALTASSNRSEAAKATNQARATALNSALDAAVLQVMGAAPLNLHGVPTVIQKRIATAVFNGKLSSAFGGTNIPTVRAIRRSLDRLITPECAIGRTAAEIGKGMP